jgi:outer membrane protein TolC
LIYAVRTFEQFRRDFAVQIATAYFGVRIAQEAIDDNRRSYQQSADLTDRTQALYDKGRINYIEVQRAIEQQLSDENGLIDAQQAYQGQLDQYKILIGMDVRQELEIVPVDLDVAEPNIEGLDPIALAIKYRLDLANTRDAIDDARRQVAVASNGLLPDLNLTMQTQSGNEVGSPAARLNSRAQTYGAGLTLGLPLDRVAQRNAYRQALIGVDQAQRNYVDAEQQAIADVRATIRAIHADESAVQIQRLNIEVAEQRLDYANELLKQGQQSSRDVVEAQQELLLAETTFEQAHASLQTDDLEFLDKTGTLRVDPSAGSLGRAMDRAMAGAPTGLEPQYRGDE